MRHECHRHVLSLRYALPSGNTGLAVFRDPTRGWAVLRRRFSKKFLRNHKDFTDRRSRPMEWEWRVSEGFSALHRRVYCAWLGLPVLELLRLTAPLQAAREPLGCPGWGWPLE